MKRTLKKILSVGLAFVMLMCTCLSVTAFAADESTVAALTAEEVAAVTPRDTALGTVIFSSTYHNGNPIPASDSQSISLNRVATKALISALPLKAGGTGKVNVTITSTDTPLKSITFTVNVETDRWIDLEAWGLDVKNYTVSYSYNRSQFKLIHLGVTFGY